MNITNRISYLLSAGEGARIKRNLVGKVGATAKAIFLSRSYLCNILNGKNPINPEQLARLYEQTNKSSDLDFIPPLLRLAEFLGKAGRDYAELPEKRVAILGNLERATQF